MSARLDLFISGRSARCEESIEFFVEREWNQRKQSSRPITPLVLTHDEAANIARTMAELLWARRIVVIDSGSTDGTLSILRKFSQVEVVHRVFTDFADQCNLA